MAREELTNGKSHGALPTVGIAALSVGVAAAVAALTGVALLGILGGCTTFAAIFAVTGRGGWQAPVPALPSWTGPALFGAIILVTGGLDVLVEHRGSDAIWRAATAEALMTLSLMWPSAEEPEGSAGELGASRPDEMPAASRREFAETL